MFRAPFAKPFSNPFPQDTTAIPWYLAGGIPAANCKAAYLSKGAASLAASYVNLANPGTYNNTLGVAPTFDASTGRTYNGSTQYLKTSLIPTDSWSVIIRFSGLTLGTNKALIGTSNDSGGAANFNIYTSSSTVYRYGHGNTAVGSISAGGVTSGIIAVAGKKIFQFSTTQNGTIAAGASTTTYLPLYIGAINYDSTVLFPAAFTEVATAIYDIDISAYMVALSAAINAL